MKGYSKIIPIDLYCRDILFVFGDTRYLRKMIRKYHSQEQTNAIMELFEGVNDYTQGVTVYKATYNAFVVWFPHLPTSPLEFGFVSHEIFHAAHAIMKNVGVNLSDDSEEAYAYLIGYLTRKVLDVFPISFCETYQVLESKPTQRECVPAKE